MFRDLARCTARLKGKRYDGAVIAAAEWQRAGSGKPLESNVLPEILLDRHGLMKVRAMDASGQLTLKMLLGREAPAPRSDEDGTLRLAADVQGIQKDGIVHLTFAAEDVAAFTRDVGDTNPLHEGARPLVPGLLIVEQLLEDPILLNCQRLRMKFITPVFAGQEVEVGVSRRRQLPSRSRLQRSRQDRRMPSSPAVWKAFPCNLHGRMRKAMRGARH